MTPKKFLSFFFIQWLLLALLKAAHFKFEIFANAGVQQIAFWIVTGLVMAAIVRRFGPITFLESFLVMFVWSFGGLLLDLLLLSPFTGLSMFTSSAYWTAFFIMNIAIFVLHKKNHIYVRNELHKQH